MPALDPHPAPETLVAYQERRLADPEAEEVREHLAACRDCAVQLLELADLLENDGASAADELSRPELDAAWERQRESLLPRAPVVPLEGRRPLPPLPSRPSWLAAASL